MWKEETSKSPVGKSHSSNCRKPDPRMGANINEQIFEEKEVIFNASISLPQSFLLNPMMKVITLP